MKMAMLMVGSSNLRFFFPLLCMCKCEPWNLQIAENQVGSQMLGELCLPYSAILNWPVLYRTVCESWSFPT